MDPEGAPPTAPKSPSGINRRKLPRRAQNYSRMQLLEAMRKKRECESVAQVVVESCLEPIESPEILINILKDINQCHYQDIIEERSIGALCGYPLCKEKITEVPRKKYHISTVSNKVYDITERKNFCSNSCFKASNYLKIQLLTSPLWLRHVEDIPEFKLLALDN